MGLRYVDTEFWSKKLHRDDDVVLHIKSMFLVIPRNPGFGTDSAGSGVTRGQSDTESARARLHLAAVVPMVPGCAHTGAISPLELETNLREG